MSSFCEWLAMGGYAAYVWPAYGLVCGVLIIHFLSIKVQKKRTGRKLQQWFKS
jgi:heme exporter protein D